MDAGKRIYQLMIHKLKNMETMQLVILLIAFFHLGLMIHCWFTQGAFIDLVHPSTWLPIIITVYALLFLGVLSLKKVFYYAYIFVAIIQGLSPTYSGSKEILELFFPFYFLFAGVLIIDLKRAIYAHHHRSDR
jgi:hypothetical protein